ncbi:MAG TPA: flavodoxin domain-containing protein [Methanotrichaceae archaeon]|nr:flavodoxin domain-containing protein [Methanotrichaceae archaeon]HQF15913.1 flavodoxin domain-containing protein [Methanotrichaceae archaeon]HQI90739.1 flavodoxin domain-containing protein [Methanotrichaceae archaeon]HQJ27983.1 flavodoxin domain-containing protein [Methanotrichaceae archaeon]
MLRTLVVYDSKYGSTEETARQLALILGPARSVRVDQFVSDPGKFELVILGGPIYKGVISPAIWNFVRDNLDWLKGRHVALFCTCLSQEDGEVNLERIRSVIGPSVLLQRTLGGRMLIEKLDGKDLLGMESFCKRKGYAFQDIDTLAREDVVNLGLAIKQVRDSLSRPMAKADLLSLIESFLASHTTCTLASGHGCRVRATPIEYSYRKGSLYLLSEGGEKFAHILLNEQVSVAVYDPYQSMSEVAGLQISGKAALVSSSEPDFWEVLRWKGLSRERISSLPISLNLIRIRIERAELLYARLKARGEEISQTLIFEHGDEAQASPSSRRAISSRDQM